MPPKDSKNTGNGQVSLSTLNAAKAQALRTGKPVPLKVNGTVVAVVQVDDRHPGQTVVQVSPGAQPLLPQVTQAVAQAKAQQPEIDQQAKTDAALRNLGAQQVGGPVWVNGQMQTVTGFHSDGTPIFGYMGSKTGKMPDTVINPITGQPLTGQSAFDALGLGASYGALSTIQGTDRFTLAHGPTDALTGMPADPANYGPAGVGASAADNSYSARVASNGTSQMTIAQGVQWLVNLANQSPDAYNKLVVELKHAGYTGANGEALTGGGYSESVGLAFARAAKDLSVQQQATGSTIGMDEYLQNRMAAQQKAAQDATPLAQRNYTDPGTLMATAKSAAQEAIGRALTPQELQAFEASFRGQENNYYNQVDAYSQAKAGAAAIGDSAPTAGFSTVQPDASGQAQSLVQGDQYGQERANYSAQNYYQAIAQMFGIK